MRRWRDPTSRDLWLRPQFPPRQDRLLASFKGIQSGRWAAAGGPPGSRLQAPGTRHLQAPPGTSRHLQAPQAHPGTSTPPGTSRHLQAFLRHLQASPGISRHPGTSRHVQAPPGTSRGVQDYTLQLPSRAASAALEED